MEVQGGTEKMLLRLEIVYMNIGATRTAGELQRKKEKTTIE